jgi:hypothetical protein
MRYLTGIGAGVGRHERRGRGGDGDCVRGLWRVSSSDDDGDDGTTADSGVRSVT